MSEKRSLDLSQRYPEKIGTKYQTFLPANGGRAAGYRYVGPALRVLVRPMAVQHFEVTRFNADTHQQEVVSVHISPDGRTAYEGAVLAADALGQPWMVTGGAEVFDPASATVWSYNLLPSSDA